MDLIKSSRRSLGEGLRLSDSFDMLTMAPSMELLGFLSRRYGSRIVRRVQGEVFQTVQRILRSVLILLTPKVLFRTKFYTLIAVLTIVMSSAKRT